MKIALINGSPKAKRSASETVLGGLRAALAPADEVYEFHFDTPVPAERDLIKLCACSVLLLAFPLYVDGVPGHLLACLERIGATLKIAPARERTVYAVCNCGFYEGEQARLALDIVAHWAKRGALRWGGGLGVGAGGMLGGSVAPMGHGAQKDLGKAVKILAHSADAGKLVGNCFVTANLPRAIYKTTGEFAWRQAVKRNGLQVKDLNTKK